MSDLSVLIDPMSLVPTDGASLASEAPFARAYAQALFALRGARLSRFGRASIEIREDVSAGRAQLRVRRYPTLPWEPCGPEVGLVFAQALQLAIEDVREGWREPSGLARAG